MHVRVRLKASLLRTFQVALLVVGLAATAIFAWLQFERYYFGSLYLQEIQHPAPVSLERLPPPNPLAGRLAPQDPDVATSPDSNPRALGRLRVPRLDLDAPVLDGIDARSLRRGAGWIPGTALPWDSGNVGIAAHRDTFFRPLRHIRSGDLVELVTRRGRRSYRVRSVYVVEPDFNRALQPTTESTLTMVTCFPFDFIGPAPRRFIVEAVEDPLSSSPQPALTHPTEDPSSAETRRAAPARTGG